MAAACDREGAKLDVITVSYDSFIELSKDLRSMAEYATYIVDSKPETTIVVNTPYSKVLVRKNDES